MKFLSEFYVMRRLFLFCTSFISILTTVAGDTWLPEQVPAKNPILFVLYYQQFLQVNPFPIELLPKSPAEEAKNRRHHERSVALYAKMSEIAAEISRSKELVVAVPDGIKREHSKRITGAWNFYQNVPVNRESLWQESCFMRYQSLSHEVSLDPSKISMLHEFVAELEKHENLIPLFQTLKRNACLRSFNFVRMQINDYENKKEKKLLMEKELGEKLTIAVRQFAPFLQKYPTEENMKNTQSVLETVDFFRLHYADSASLPEIIETLRNTFIMVQRQSVSMTVLEYAEIYEGILRRQDLVDKPMAIWGADLTGNLLDEKTLAGKVVLLDFWATWCGPCVADFPHLKKNYEKYKDKGFEIIGFSVDSNEEYLKDYLERNPIPWQILSKEATKRAGLPPLSHYYGAKQLPVVLLRGRDGKTVSINARGQKLDDILEKLFE